MNLTDVFTILVDAIAGIFDIATQLFNSFNLVPFLIGSFTIYTLYRLLIVPLIGGSAGSDSAKSKKNKGDDNTDG